MNRLLQSRPVTFVIALVWGLFAVCGKLAPLTPLHQQIVARVFGDAISLPLVRCIGIAELLMAFWVLSGYKRRICGVTQIVLVVIMNTIEFVVASDLLLWGKLNSLFAVLFTVVVYFNLVRREGDGTSPEIPAKAIS